MSTAGGSHIKDYGIKQGLKPKSKGYKEYLKGDRDSRVKTIMDHQIKTNKNITRSNHNDVRLGHKSRLRELEREQNHARIAIGATGVAGVSAYAAHKARQSLKENNNYYR